MRYRISEPEQKRARAPHNLFVINILLFHLMLAPAAIVIDVGRYGMLLPLLFSAAVIFYIYIRSRRSDAWFVAAHWKLAFRRCLLLMLGYAVTAIFLLVAWLVTMGMADATMKDILNTAITRIGIMPTLIMAMVTVVLEAGGLNQVARGEVPDGVVAAFPPPEDVIAVQDS